MANRTYIVDGQVYTAPANTLRVESTVENLLPYPTGAFQSQWIQNGGVVTVDNDQVAPDGTTTASTVAGSGGNIYENITSTGQSYTFTVWIRAASPVTCFLGIYDNMLSGYVVQTDKNIGTTWQQFSVSAPVAPSGHTLAMTISPTPIVYAGPQTIYVWNANAQPTANVPFISGALVEPPSTNLTFPSIPAIGSGQWQNIVGTPTVTVNAAVAPDGSTTATEIASSVASDQIGARSTAGIAGTSIPLTASIWMKGNAGGEKVQIYSYDETVGGSVQSQTYVLTTSWVRYTVTGTFTVASTDMMRWFAISNASTGVQTWFVWGAQCEQLPCATSLISTTSATASANGDLITVPSYLVSPASGSFSCDAQLLPNVPAATIQLGLFSSDSSTVVGAWSLQGEGGQLGVYLSYVGGIQSRVSFDYLWHHYGVAWEQTGPSSTMFWIYYDRALLVSGPIAGATTVANPAIGSTYVGTGFGQSWIGHIANVRISTDIYNGL